MGSERMKIEVPDEYFCAEELKNTPKRVKRFWNEWLVKSNNFKFTTFKNPGYDQMVTLTNVQFYSMCAHHLLPFQGKIHVGYIPDKRICGLSKLARVIDKFSHKPQLQEKLTQEIANFLDEKLKPKGVAVLIEGEHMCMSCRGVKKPGAVTVTTALKGKFHEADVKQEFLDLVYSRRRD